MTPHPLDRPVWNALSGRQAHVARGDARARRFDAEYGLFAAAADGAADNLEALAALVPAAGHIALMEAEAAALPPGVAVISQALCRQMVLRQLAPGEPGFAITTLDAADAAEMWALAQRTGPGPFFARTSELGDFVGVRHGGRLVAMAGERMKPEGFTEVSGVCTDPDHRGRGYAGGLMRTVAAAILARGETPFLHVYAANVAAVALYRRLGFEHRRDLMMSTLGR